MEGLEDIMSCLVLGQVALSISAIVSLCMVSQSKSQPVYSCIRASTLACKDQDWQSARYLIQASHPLPNNSLNKLLVQIHVARL